MGPTPPPRVVDPLIYAMPPSKGDTMKRPLFATGTALIAAIAATFVGGAPANAAGPPPRYSYHVYTGATQVSALGVTVQSDATAESRIIGQLNAKQEAKIASAKAGSVLVAGVANTEATAAYNPTTGGVTVRSFARTAGVSLFGGVIKLKAVETTASIEADDGGAPTPEMTTEVLGLTIQGKAYNAPIDPNTGITIPGLVSIQLNQQDVAANENSAVIMGGGLRVTLLGNRNGTSAGATVLLNPVAQVLQPANNNIEPGYALQGAAYGSYVNATVGDEVQVETGKTALINMPTQGTGGKTATNSTAKAQLNGVLNLGAIYTEQRGIRNEALSQSEESASIANVNLFGGLITAKALSVKSTATVTQEGDTTSGDSEGEMTFVNLKIAGKSIPIDVGPNTTINVLNLGTVTINKQITAAQSGAVPFHAQRTIGLEIVLDTKRAGLPVGAVVQVAFTQALVWQ